MMYMDRGVTFSGQIEELNYDEIAIVGGSGKRELAQGALLAGGALSTIGASARLLALVPSPFSPALGAFGATAGFIGAGLSLGGGALMVSSSGGSFGVNKR